MIKAVLYDLDGLLVDTEAIHGVASERALNRYGHTLEDLPHDLRIGFYGKRVIDIAGEVVDCLGLPVGPAQWAGERLEVFMELIAGGVSLMPGAEQSLALFGRKGMRTALVSSGNRRYVERILELTGMTGAFEAVITGDDVTAGKPDPQCYLEGARVLDARPHVCLVLEDAYAGIRAARAAGMKVIAIENKYSSNYQGADLVLASLADID
ncbi:MAG: HAD family phosphatase, partial [Gemmatimonadota bacterium]|nr:HAD family phosphatase [Gemmatimonadota bacterium]